jgi:hypothetical protein
MPCALCGQKLILYFIGDLCHEGHFVSLARTTRQSSVMKLCGNRCFTFKEWSYESFEFRII